MNAAPVGGWSWEDAMPLAGGCYCGATRYVADGDPVMKGQCHCRECQYIAGGSVNMFMVMPTKGFRYVAGAPKTFTRANIANPVTREFCPDCGTHLTTRRPDLPPFVILKVGTLDEPSAFGGPQIAIYTCDKQAFQAIPEGLPAFDKGPPR